MLAKKMLRDIKNNKTQFLSIFLMAFLGIFAFTGICGESFGLEQTVNQFYDDTNLADGWVYDINIDNSTVDKVNNLSQTTNTERQMVVSSVGDFDNNPDITLHFLETNDISQFYLLEGEDVNISDSNGVWLDKRFADAKDLEIGDNIAFKINGIAIEKEIKGLGYSPEYVYEASQNSIIPDFEQMGFAYLSYKAFPTAIQYNALLVDFNGSAINFVNALDNQNITYLSFTSQSNHQSVSQFQQEIDQHEMMGDIFPLVFILIAFLTLLTTMTRIINHQRTQIGILKAVGYKNRTIIIHYMSYGFWLVLAGAILGLILGPLTIPQLFYPSMSSFYTLPAWKPAWSINFVIIAMVMVILSLMVSYLAVRSISNENPADTIRPKAPKVSTNSWFEKSKIWSKLNFNIRWNYRDAKRNKFRALMAIVGVMGCTALLISAFGMNDGMEDLKVWEYNDINHFESKLILETGASQSNIDNIVEDVNGDTIMEGAIELKVNDTKKTGMLLVLNETDLITPTDDERQTIDIDDDEVSISIKMAENLGVGVGDTVQWHVLGSDKWVKTKIDKVHGEPISQGLIMSDDKLDDIGLNYTPTSILTTQNVGDENYTGVETINTIDSLTASWDDMTESMMMMVFILIFFAAILAIVVLYNLGILSFTEIEREIATLKVLGFKTSSLRKLLLTQNIVFTAIGFVLGVPLGYYLMKLMMDSAGESFYYPIHLSPQSVLISAAITFALSILVNLMFSGKIKNLNMVEALKDVE